MFENSNPLPPGHGHLGAGLLYVLFAAGDVARKSRAVIVEQCIRRWPDVSELLCGACIRNISPGMAPIPDSLLRQFCRNPRLTNGFHSQDEAVDAALLADLDLVENLCER